jgi:Ca2+-binding EF-hand superfamily protein/mono/diheme cytochrome c family protein
MPIFLMKTTLTLFLALAGLSLASAQSPDGGVFQRFDTNADGKVTSAELPNAQAFERFDVNKDGAITLDEYTQVVGGTVPTTPTKPGETPAPSNPLAATIKSFDANGDGKITREDAAGASWFAEADQNSDGVLDDAELQRLSLHAQKLGNSGQFEAMVKNYDKDGDGKITREEGAGAKFFDRLDQNSDGVLDATELERLRAFMQKAGGGTGTPTQSGETPPGTKPATTVPADSIFSGYDKNTDGKVTTDELASPQAFARFDLDKDGAISLAEYNQVSGKTPPTTTPGTPAASSPAVSQIDGMVKQFDVNADGKITRKESAGAQWFNRVDSNADGVIDAEELEMVKRIVSRGGAGAGRGMPSAAPAITPEDVKKVTSGPEVLKPGDVGIGRMIEDLSFTTLDGQSASLSGFKRKSSLVILMTSATCPVSKRYIPSVAKLATELTAQNVALLLLNPFASETADEIKAQLTEAGITAAYLHDKDKKLAAMLHASTTTEVFLLDATRTLVYRGAFDDQYGINYSLDAPKHRYLHDAISAHLKGETPAIQATAAPGCELDLADAPKLSLSPVTYHRDVARILQQNCVTCHRDGGIAPFALDDLAEVKDHAKVIKRVITEGTMPPWFAAIEKDAEKNPWVNDCSLSAKDKADLLAWIESSDRPLGNVAEAPANRTYPAEWRIGTPDLIIPLSRAYDIKADGFMPYAFDVVDTDIAEDQWVTAYEILPSERDVVHHVIVQVHEKGSDARDREEGAGGYWAIYVPGNGACVYPDGFARKIPAGARVSFQIHYTPSGKAKKERLRMGLVFAKTAPQYEVKTLALANNRIAIPPGASHHVETQSRRVPFDIPITSYMAHMHIRGKAFKYEVTYADGKTETLLDIPRYDFNWQLRYDYKEPKLIPRGSTLTITAAYDNSAENKANPDPSKLVKWGSQTVDEMMLGYFEYFVPLSGTKVAMK